VGLTPVANKKIFSQKIANFFKTPLSSRVNIYCRYIFFFTFTLRFQQSDSVSIICHPPVSTTPTVPAAKFAAGVNDTGAAPSLANISTDF
jgi:hypothetical protein